MESMYDKAALWIESHLLGTVSAVGLKANFIILVIEFCWQIRFVQSLFYEI